MFLNILHFFSGLFPRFFACAPTTCRHYAPKFPVLAGPDYETQCKGPAFGGCKTADRKIGIWRILRSLRLAHRQNASFRTSPQTGVGISIELWATYRHTDRPFVPFSGIYPREVVRLTGGLPRQCAHWLAMTGNSINSNFMICLLMPITLIPICRVSGTLAFGYALPVSRRNMGVSMGFSKR